MLSIPIKSRSFLSVFAPIFLLVQVGPAQVWDQHHLITSAELENMPELKQLPLIPSVSSMSLQKPGDRVCAPRSKTANREGALRKVSFVKTPSGWAKLPKIGD